MLKFTIPFYYLVYSRLKRMGERLSLIYIYPLFLVTFIFIFYQIELIPALLSFLLGFVGWVSVYEIGYLVNDTLTIEKEKKPNFRISQMEITTIRENFWLIVFLRAVYFLFILVGLNLLNLYTSRQLFLFMGFVLISVFIFYLHNTFRSRVNILTYFILCFMKYTVFPGVYLGMEYGFSPYFIVLVSFPILRTLEHARKPKYRLIMLQKLVGNLDFFRVKYYGFMLLFYLVTYCFFDQSIILIFSLFYFFLFRFLIWVLVFRGNYSRKDLT